MSYVVLPIHFYKYAAYSSAYSIVSRTARYLPPVHPFIQLSVRLSLFSIHLFVSPSTHQSVWALRYAFYDFHCCLALVQLNTDQRLNTHVMVKRALP